jgi:Alpha-kinase family
MTYPSSAARTNLTSNDVRIESTELGRGAFRVCLAGTFVGGNRNGQEAACKRFKPQFRAMEQEYFAGDYAIVDKVVTVANDWNRWCKEGREIMVNRGSIHYSNSGIPYLVEPYIRYYEKFTGNTGWIAPNDEWHVRAMEAFSHFSYHFLNGSAIVCDLQGRYKYNRYDTTKSRFELTDPAICSRRRLYGLTDLGEKGIESFFACHECNEFCGGNWKRPYGVRQWFPLSQGTSMLSSRLSDRLKLSSPATFRMGMNNIIEEDELSDYSDAY